MQLYTMGLSFHFTAKIQQLSQIRELTEEVQDICESMDWEYKIWDETVEIPEVLVSQESVNGDLSSIRLKGIAFTPPKCDTIWLTCLPSRRLCSLLGIMAADAYPDPEWMYYIHVKTQFAGVDVHIAVITLLKYLEQKYLTDMEMSDEGHYWETLDKVLLKKRFEEYDLMMEVVIEALENSAIHPSSDTNTLAKQIEEILRKRLNKK